MFKAFSLVVAIAIVAWPTGNTFAASMMSDTELTALRDLVHHDPEAGACFDELRKTADAARVETPNPIERITTEGKLKTDPAKIRTLQSLGDMPKIAALGYAFAVTQDSAYADQARRYLLAWAKVNTSGGDPINDTSLERAVVAYVLVRSTCSPPERETVDAWLKQTASAELKSAANRKSVTKNNWQSHRLKIIGLIGMAVQDAALQTAAIDGLRKHVDVNLNPDGSGLDFRDRDALHYHLYTLEPMLTLAIAARKIAPDLYGYESPRGSSIAKSVQWTVPFCDGRQTHAEFVKSTVAFDKKRADSGDPRYAAGRLFEPAEAASMLTLASYFDRSLSPLALKLSRGDRRRFKTWPDVLIAAYDPPSK